MKHKNILILEDNLDFSQVLESDLKDLGALVFNTEHTETAIKYARDMNIDYAIIDLKIPGERNGGHVLIDYLKKNNPDCIRIVASGCEDELRKVQPLDADLKIEKGVNVNKQICDFIFHNPDENAMIKNNRDSDYISLCERVEKIEGRVDSIESIIKQQTECINKVLENQEWIRGTLLKRIMETEDLTSSKIRNFEKFKMDHNDNEKDLIKSIAENEKGMYRWLIGGTITGLVVNSGSFIALVITLILNKG